MRPGVFQYEFLRPNKNRSANKNIPFNALGKQRLLILVVDDYTPLLRMHSLSKVYYIQAGAH